MTSDGRCDASESWLKLSSLRPRVLCIRGSFGRWSTLTRLAVCTWLGHCGSPEFRLSQKVKSRHRVAKVNYGMVVSTGRRLWDLGRSPESLLPLLAIRATLEVHGWRVARGDAIRLVPLSFSCGDPDPLDTYLGAGEKFS